MKLTTSSSRPVLFSGRRAHAIRPLAAKDKPTTRSTDDPDGARPQVVAAEHDDERDRGGRECRRAPRDRGGGAGRAGSFEERQESRPRQLGLRDEASRPAALDERAEVGAVAARDEDDGGPAAAVRQAGGDLEAVDVRELHVEQHELRRELGGSSKRGRPVLGLADDLEALGLEQRPGVRPEARVVVDDQNVHVGLIVADGRHGDHTGNRTMQRLTPQGSRTGAAAVAAGSASIVVAQGVAFDGGAWPGGDRGGVDAGRVPGREGSRCGHGGSVCAAARREKTAARCLGVGKAARPAREQFERAWIPASGGIVYVDRPAGWPTPSLTRNNG